ncbi:MAG: hypothetical protein GX620_04355 [Chloroflexi bacterium]|nr:hypothetical protein [Chloroflexota bacterium]
MTTNNVQDSLGSFRYDTSGTWFRGNMHIHSVMSDGGKTFQELAEMYAAEGYHFLYRTDHWVISDVRSDANSYPLLWLDGVELDGYDKHGGEYHVVCLGTFTGISREMGFETALNATRNQGGVLILAHPHWMGNTLEEALRWPFDGAEVYNHGCHFGNGKGEGGVYWHAMLAERPDVLGFAADDAHINTEDAVWNGGWIVVNVPELSRSAINGAVQAGNFYSSCGPDFQSIELVGDDVVITCSPVRDVWMVGPRSAGERSKAPKGGLITEARFKIPTDWPYVLLEIEDADGRLAWTNTLFTPRTGSMR